MQRKAKVTAFVPHYAMSGGSLIALAADEIVMDPNAVLGPVDPQIGDMPAASIVKVLSLKKPEDISDEMLILADMSAKARVQVGVFVMEVLLKHMAKDKAVALATTLTEGRWTHDFPITVEMARGLGLPAREICINEYCRMTGDLGVPGQLIQQAMNAAAYSGAPKRI